MVDLSTCRRNVFYASVDPGSDAVVDIEIARRYGASWGRIVNISTEAADLPCGEQFLERGVRPRLESNRVQSS